MDNKLKKDGGNKKNCAKKIFGFVSSRFLFFIIGLFISVAVLTAYAAWNDPVAPGDPLTATKWNDFVDKVADMETEMDSEWKMLAQGSDYTEEALITLEAAGASFDTDHAYTGQRVNIGTLKWPEGDVNEIIFKVDNRYDNFCAGGGLVLDLEGDGGWVNPTCLDLKNQGITLTPENFAESDGIQMAINGVDMEYCPDQYGRKSTDPTHKGTEGHYYWNTLCYYKSGDDYASSTINKIEIKEYDHSADYGAWRWEIWYR